MRRTCVAKTLLFLAIVLLGVGCSRAGGGPLRARTMASVGSERALDAMLDNLVRRREAEELASRRRQDSVSALLRSFATVPAPSLEVESGSYLIRRHRRAPIAGEQPREAVVVGSVMNTAFQPLFGAGVGVEALATQVGTDGSGAYRLLLRLREDSAAVVVRARLFGYAPRVHEVLLHAGDSVEVHFVLRPDVNRLSQVVVTGTRGASITNVQSEGVDEGGIVKLVGDHLVILRHGELHSVSSRTRRCGAANGGWRFHPE